MGPRPGTRCCLRSDEWAGVERGVIQRAELLNLVLDRSVRSPRPAAATARCPPSWSSATPASSARATGSACPAPQQLFTCAVDLARDADGRLLGARRPHPGPVGGGLRPGEPGGDLPGVPEPVPRRPGPPAGPVLPDAAGRSARRRARPTPTIPAIVLLTPGPVERDRLRARLPGFLPRLPAGRGHRPHRAGRPGVAALARAAGAVST